MTRITGRICRFSLVFLTTFVQSDARPTQWELSRAAQTELVICDHTIDITYIRLRRDWLYLVAILDWYSRFVITWQLSDTLEIPFVLTAVDQALAQTKPVIWNSDQGSHFTSPQYTQRLLDKEVKISMDGRGRALDNIFVERLWRSVKYEEVYPSAYETPRQARLGLTHYFHRYNHVRIH